MTTRPDVRPIINHVAISVDASVLDAAGRAALLDFYGEVFGWTEGDNSTEKGNPLIVYTGEMRQYLYFLPATDDFLRAPYLDHFGLEISSVDELTAILDRAKAYREKDDRVTVIDLDQMTTHGSTSDFTLTNAYISFLIPLQIELQHIAEVQTG
ncbi:MAG: hypothetical protein ABSF33_02970 [Acidimicrobiales bacterium]|jgi:predicted enzyme related to lactoylglutathione lyase